MGKGALAFIAGLGTGYLNQKNREEEKARQDKFDQIALDRGADEKLERDRKKKITSEISNVAQEGLPIEIQDRSVPIQQSNQASPIAEQGIAPGKTEPQATSQSLPIAARGLSNSSWQVGGKSFADAETAGKAALDYNTPEARNARVAQVYRANGDHATALELEAKAKQASLTDFQTKVEQRKYARSLQQEGVFDAAAALRRGDAESIKKAFNDSGQHKIEGDVIVSPVERDIPGVGKKTTYQATFNVIGPDGKPKQMSYNSHDLSMQLMPAEKALDWDHTIFQDKTRQDQWKQEFDHRKKTDAESLGIQRQRVQAPREGAPIWDASADKALVGLYTKKDESGNETTDSQGILFAKRIGVALASQNGGDSFSAAHQAATTDNRLRIKAGNDPQKLAELRSQYLDSISGQRANNPLDNTAQQPSPKAQGKPSGTARVEAPPVAPPVKASEYKGITYAEKLKQGMKTIGETIGSGIDYVKEKDQQIIRDRNLHEVKQRMEDRLDLNAAQKKIAIDAGLMIDDLKKTK